tara:strand:- start:934 stop:1689 length:756 start_codon:yes stop_codon:yes gene_type:complete
MRFRLTGRSHGMVAGYKRRTSETLAGIAAAASVCAGTGLMLSGRWPGNQSQATIAEQRSGSALSELELLRAQALSHPRDWRWSLLLARAQHRQGDRNGAVRTLRPLQRLHPDQPEVIALWSLLALEAEQSTELIKSLNEQSGNTPSDRRLGLGLLLADLERLSGELKAASDRYLSLIKDNPQKPEPLLALAMLKKDQGEGTEAITLLRKAMGLRENTAGSARDLQTLELRWALEAARNRPASSGLKAEPTP